MAAVSGLLLGRTPYLLAPAFFRPSTPPAVNRRLESQHGQQTLGHAFTADTIRSQIRQSGCSDYQVRPPIQVGYTSTDGLPAVHAQLQRFAAGVVQVQQTIPLVLNAVVVFPGLCIFVVRQPAGAPGCAWPGSPRGLHL